MSETNLQQMMRLKDVTVSDVAKLLRRSYGVTYDKIYRKEHDRIAKKIEEAWNETLAKRYGYDNR